MKGIQVCLALAHKSQCSKSTILPIERIFWSLFLEAWPSLLRYIFMSIFIDMIFTLSSIPSMLYRRTSHLPMPISFLECKSWIKQKFGNKVTKQFRSLVILLTKRRLHLKFGIYRTLSIFTSFGNYALLDPFTRTLSPLGMLTCIPLLIFLKFMKTGSRQVTWLVAPKSMVQVGLGFKYQPCWFMVSKHHLVASLVLCIAQAWDMYMATLLFHVCNLWFRIRHLLWSRNGFILSSLPPIRVPYLFKTPFNGVTIFT